jgi:hypothetical protein
VTCGQQATTAGNCAGLFAKPNPLPDGQWIDVNRVRVVGLRHY